MDDQLDNDLRNHIREVFENFEDTHADEDWLLLREKYPEKAKRRPAAWIWWSSAAAVLLLFLGILWLMQAPVNKQNLAIAKKPHLANPAPKTIEAKKENGNENDVQVDSIINSLRAQNIANNSNKTHAGSRLKNKPDKSEHQPLTSSVLDNPGSTINKSATQNDNISQLAAIGNTKTQDQNNNAALVPKLDTGLHPAKSLATTAKPEGINMMKEVKKANKLPFSDDELADNKSAEKSKSKDKAVVFGVYAATYFNYAKGSNNQLNVGAGFTSDIKLSKNLNLSTGVAIAQNTLTYANQPPVANNSSQANAAAIAAAKSSANYFAVDGQSIYSLAAPTLKNYNASLVGLDVPLNLKYEFNPEKSPSYVSIGLSSGTFINETYTSSYNYNTPLSSNVSQIPDQSSHQSFNSFYFAKTLNFSFGTGLTLGGNRLIIEPFVKYPLEGLGSEQLKFGAGGLNLKFNFLNQKK
jgi:hypothetical protein